MIQAIKLIITDGRSFVTRRGVNPLLLVDAGEETDEDHSFLLKYIVRQAYKLTLGGISCSSKNIY